VVPYIAAFAAALLVDTVPVFAPPAWTILAFIIVKWHPNPWGIIAAGALGSVIGRYILTRYMPRLSARIFRRWEHDNLSFLGKKLGGRFWQANTFVLLYAISPLSTTSLFTAGSICVQFVRRLRCAVRVEQVARVREREARQLGDHPVLRDLDAGVALRLAGGDGVLHDSL